MQVTVHSVKIPAMSALGFGEGTDPDGNTVTFVGDHRPMHDIGEAIRSAGQRDELPVAEVEDGQLTS